MFSLLARMRHGLYYNTYLVSSYDKVDSASSLTEWLCLSHPHLLLYSQPHSCVALLSSSLIPDLLLQTQSFNPTLTPSLPPSFTHFFPPSLPHFTHFFLPSLTSSLPHSLPHSLTSSPSLPHSLTSSLPPSLPPSLPLSSLPPSSVPPSLPPSLFPPSLPLSSLPLPSLPPHGHQLPGCRGSGLMQAFTKHLVPRLGIQRESSDPHRLRVTLLSRSTKQRRLVNKDEVRCFWYKICLQALKCYLDISIYDCVCANVHLKDFLSSFSSAHVLCFSWSML